MTDLVLTPGGYKPANLVHRVPAQHLIRMNGNVAELAHLDGRLVQSIGPIERKVAQVPLMPANLSRLLPDRTRPAGLANPGGPGIFKRRFGGSSIKQLRNLAHGAAGAVGLAQRLRPGTTLQTDVGGLVARQPHSGTATLERHVGLQPDLSDRAHETLDPRRVIPFATIDGWVAYSGWTNNSGQPISRLATTWIVPPAPVNHGDQTIFLFNGIQNSTMIYQPVLQWGSSAAGGGKRWSIASWYADGQTGLSFHTDLIDVAVGQSLTGIMTLTGQANGKFNYDCVFQGIAGTSLPIMQVEELTWANETLEAYGVTDCGDYPDTSRTRMTNIVLQTGTAKSSLAWIDNDAKTQCGAHCTVVNNSANGGEVDIWYRDEHGVGAWEARHGLDNAHYQATFDDLGSNQGMQLICVSGYEENGQDHYAAIWRKNANAPALAAHHGLTSAQHQQLFTDLPAQGFFPVLVNGYRVGGQDRYASIWHNRPGAPAWAARHGLSAADYQHAFNELTGQGFAPMWVSGYGSGNDARFAAVFHKFSGQPATQARHGLSSADYQAFFDQMLAQGFHPRCVSGYGDRYAAIFDKPGPVGGFAARHGLDAGHYQQLFSDLPPQGLHPVLVNGYNTPGGVRFAAVWEK